MTMNRDEVATELGMRIQYHSNALRKTKRLLMKSKDRKYLQLHHRNMLNYYKERLQALRILGDENESIERDESIIIEKGRIYRDV